MAVSLARWCACGAIHRTTDTPNQDVAVAQLCALRALLAVSDGHGDLGHDVAAHVAASAVARFKAALPLDRAWAQTATSAAHQLPQCRESGASASVLTATLDLGAGSLAVEALSIGDCSAFLWLWAEKDGAYRLIEQKELAERHRPVDAHEAARIHEAGGIIRGQYLVHPHDEALDWPRVSGITRSVGDLEMEEAGLSHVWASRSASVSLASASPCPSAQPRSGRAPLAMLLVASDGLWDHCSHAEILAAVQRAIDELGPSSDAEAFLKFFTALLQKEREFDDDCAIGVLLLSGHC